MPPPIPKQSASTTIQQKHCCTAVTLNVPDMRIKTVPITPDDAKKKYLNNVTHFSSNEKRKRNETAKCFNKMSPNATPPNEMSPNQIASIGPLTKGSKTKLLDAVVRSQVAFTQPPRMGSPRFRQKYEVFSMLACSLDPTKPPNAPIKCLNKMLQGCVFSRT